MHKKTNPYTEEKLRIVSELKNLDPGSEAYSLAVQNLKTLHDSEDRIGKDKVVDAGLHVFELISILNFERFAVLTTKVFSRLRRF